jgi:GNAT superfamily N-acetyltransferase
MSIDVRHADASDAEAVAALSAEFGLYLGTLGDDTDYQFSAETYRRDGFGAEPAFRGLVAVHNARVIGYLLYTFGYDTDHGRRILNIEDLYVSKHTRRRGVGKALIEMAGDVCRTMGIKEICWSVYKTNLSAYAFYAQQGAKLVDDEDFMYLVVD